MKPSLFAALLALDCAGWLPQPPTRAATPPAPACHEVNGRAPE